MVEGRSADVVMLGFDGFRVFDAVEVDGELEVLVETAKLMDWCRTCGVRAHAHSRPEPLVRDVDAFGRPVRLRWRKRRWRCREAACPTVTWTETHPAIAPRAVLTQRACRAACRRVGRDGLAVAAVAREYGTGRHTIMRAVWEHGAPLVDDPARLADVAMLGMDETAWLKANRWHHTMYVSGLVDTATGRLLDVVPDRTAKAVTAWLAQPASTPVPRRGGDHRMAAQRARS